MNFILYIISFVIFILIIVNLNEIIIKKICIYDKNKNNDYYINSTSFLFNKIIITIYKNPIFKLIFLFGLYLYGYQDIILTSLLAFYYVYIGQIIQNIELL